MARIRKSLQNTGKIVWEIALYIRLSKEDGNDESLSVENQRKILIDYLEKNLSEEDYVIAGIYIDDGLTGTDTNRESFMRMKQDIVDGKVNCVIVKSLARAFRNLADQQKFLEEFLPIHKTRFINLGNPFIDTFINPNAVSGFEVPIRGMFNEQFAAVTSEEVRKTFNMKRSRGEFIGAFAPYGYRKNPDNKNHLLIDEEVATVVKDIFNWFLYEGLSINGIAKELNERGIPSPIEYKKIKGLKYQNPNNKFKVNLWSSTTVAYMLKNRMYVGCMVQGKQRVISYKIHKQVKTPESEWFVKEGTHEPIIDLAVFEEVQKRLLRDTRTAPSSNKVHMFSGFLKCTDCGRALHRKSSKNITYYYCRVGRQLETVCKRRSIREDVLDKTILKVIQTQISLIEDLRGMINNINCAPVTVNQSARLNNTLAKQQKELEKLNHISDSLYADWKGEVITKDEYLRMKSNYAAKKESLTASIDKLESERQIMKQGVTSENTYFKTFLKHKNVLSLNRELLVDLVDIISLHDDGTVEIKFNFEDQYKRVVEFIENNIPNDTQNSSFSTLQCCV